jgi:PAS domain S-box-containing protein
VAGSIRDITEHKQMEESLRKSEARFALAMRGTDEGLRDWEIVTNENYFSSRFRELLGYEAGEFEETLESFTSCLYPDDYDGTQKAIQAHLDDRKPYDLQYWLQTKSGKYRWFHARGHADKQGSLVRMAGSIRDITQQRQAETALRDSEERFRTLSTSSPIGIFQTDTTGAVVYTNPMWQQIAGQTLQESLGLGCTKTIAPEDQEAVAAAWQAYVDGQRDYSLEYRLVRPDGELCWDS